MPIRILCLGKTREPWIRQGLEEYIKRLAPHWKVRWQELKDTSLRTGGSVDKVKAAEAAALLRALSEKEYLIALDETGTALDSPAFARKLETLLPARELVFAIGGAYGLDASVLQRAGLVLSFSRFTFTHQMVRLLLIEQLYRAWTILSGKTYHY